VVSCCQLPGYIYIRFRESRRRRSKSQVRSEREIRRGLDVAREECSPVQSRQGGVSVSRRSRWIKEDQEQKDVAVAVKERQCRVSLMICPPIGCVVIDNKSRDKAQSKGVDENAFQIQTEGISERSSRVTKECTERRRSWDGRDKRETSGSGRHSGLLCQTRSRSR